MWDLVKCGDRLQVNLTNQTSSTRALVIYPEAFMTIFQILTFVWKAIFLSSLEAVWFSFFPVLIVWREWKGCSFIDSPDKLILGAVGQWLPLSTCVEDFLRSSLNKTLRFTFKGDHLFHEFVIFLLGENVGEMSSEVILPASRLSIAPFRCFWNDLVTRPSNLHIISSRTNWSVCYPFCCCFCCCCWWFTCFCRSSFITFKTVVDFSDQSIWQVCATIWWGFKVLSWLTWLSIEARAGGWFEAGFTGVGSVLSVSAKIDPCRCWSIVKNARVLQTVDDSNKKVPGPWTLSQGRVKPYPNRAAFPSIATAHVRLYPIVTVVITVSFLFTVIYKPCPVAVKVEQSDEYDECYASRLHFLSERIFQSRVSLLVFKSVLT